MKHYTDLFIDFDDTLYDTHGNAVLSLHELFDYFGLGRWFADPDVFYTNYWLTNVDLWSRYARGEITRDYLIVERFRRPLSTGNGFEPTEEFSREVGDKFLELCSCKPGVIAGAHQLMDHLKSRGYRMHLCSNGFHEVQYKKLEASHLKDYFDTICLSEDAGANKPQRAFYEYALKMSGASVPTTLMIGDNFYTDIAGAKSVGIDTMFFNVHPDEFQAPEPVTFEVHSLPEIIDIL